jgi:hypothetical protein
MSGIFNPFIPMCLKRFADFKSALSFPEIINFEKHSSSEFVIPKSDVRDFNPFIPMCLKRFADFKSALSFPEIINFGKLEAKFQ